MMQFLEQYGYIGIFLGLLASGCGFPIPEELPVITAGIIVGHEGTGLKWYVMIPVIIVGVVLGDGVLYATGRIWGDRLLRIGWVQRNLVPPDKRAEIEKNFHDRGIAVLLGARLLPGIRTPIFIMAGVMKLPVGKFLLADGLYAIPGVNLLFWLAYFLTDQVLAVFNQIERYRPLVMVAVLSAVAGALIYKYLLTRKVSTGERPHVPDIIAKPAEAVVHAVELAVEKVTHRHERAADHHSASPPDPHPAPSANGEPAPAAPPAAPREG
jgi:membrane protein DedA with SNARE-associated domain